MATEIPSKLTLTYFKIGGRAEAIRLAAAAGKVPFTNKTISFPEFAELKKSFPLGQVPILEIEMPSGEKSTITQSDAILRYFGKRGGLYPTDDLLAMKVDSTLNILEDLSATLVLTVKGAKGVGLSENDWTSEEKISIRQTWVEKSLPRFLSPIETDLKASKSGWIVGDSVTIADLLLYAKLNWIKGGVLDGIPPEVLNDYPACLALFEKVKTVGGIKEWMETYSVPYESFDYQP
jgi:glutathione S-transferase